MFSSNRCCLALLAAVEEEEEGEEEWRLVLVEEAAPEEARFNCSRECAVDNSARSTLGGSGKEDAEGRPVVPDRNPRATLSGTPRPPLTPRESSASARRLRPLEEDPLEPEADWLPSESAGGRSESESSGFCSRWRRK